MATVKQGILTKAREAWKHLRPYVKRLFWKRERRAAQREAWQRWHQEREEHRGKW